MYVCMYTSTFIWQCTYVAVFLSSLFSRSCCSHFYCITSLNLNRAEPSFGSHGCSPGSLWHLAALRGWVSATCKHRQTKYTHTCTHIQTKHRRARHTCSWPFPRSCSELLARLSLSLFVSSMFGSTTTTTAAKSTTAAPTATVACVSIIFCRAWHWKRDKRAENNVPIPAAEDRRAANSNRNQCRTRN